MACKTIYPESYLINQRSNSDSEAVPLPLLKQNKLQAYKELTTLEENKRPFVIPAFPWKSFSVTPTAAKSLLTVTTLTWSNLDNSANFWSQCHWYFDRSPKMLYSVKSNRCRIPCSRIKAGDKGMFWKPTHVKNVQLDEIPARSSNVFCEADAMSRSLFFIVLGLKSSNTLHMKSPITEHYS